MYVGLENANAVAAIDTVANKVISTIASGQSPQGMVYIPNAVPTGPGTDNLTPLGISGDAVHLSLSRSGATGVATTVVVNNQGLVDILQAAVTGVEPKKAYFLALANNADGSGPLEPIARFMGNPAGAAIVGAVGPLRKAVQGSAANAKRYLVIAPVVDDKPGTPIQIQR